MINYPFEDIGCMFLHVQSSRCFFSGICTRKLCPYSHIPNRTDNDESSNKSDAVTEESESENVTREVNLFNDVLNSYHEEEADKTVDMDELCDNILQNTSIVFNNGEEDILSDSFIDNLIMHKERQLLKLNTDDSDKDTSNIGKDTINNNLSLPNDPIDIDISDTESVASDISDFEFLNLNETNQVVNNQNFRSRKYRSELDRLNVGFSLPVTRSRSGRR